MSVSIAAAARSESSAAASRFIGIPYRRFDGVERYDVLVIGSGIGGLGLAALLAKIAGLRVLVLERHYTAGGFTHVFHRPGFEWDVGVHYVGQVHVKESQAARLLDYLTEGRLAWNPMPDVYDRVIVDGLRFDYVTGKTRLREALVAAFPREREAIDRYFTLVDRTIRRLSLFFAEKAVPPLAARLVGRGLRAPFLKLARRTTADVLADLHVSPELKAVLTAQWVDYGLPPGESSFGIHAIIAQHYFEGGAYPVGGASRIAASLLPTIERAGGALVIDAAVDRILVDRGRAIGVRMSDGREFRASAIVSDSGIRTTMALLPPGPSREVERIVERLRSVPPSAAHLCLYVGLASSSMRLNASNLLIHPTLDYDRNWARFAQDLNAPFPVLYISFPSAKDPTYQARYPGHQTIEVVVPAPYEPFAAWKATQWKHRGGEYENLKKVLADRLLDDLYRYCPETRGSIVRSELSTPLSTRHFTSAPTGETYGLAHTPARFALRDLQPRTPIRQLFLTGQDVATCGVMGALFGAAMTASIMLRRNVVGVATKAAAS